MFIQQEINFLTNSNFNQTIFNSFSPTNNIQFSKLSPQDKKELINLFKKHPITYRQILGSNNNITFGLKIEFQKKYHSIINKQFIKHFKNTFNQELLNARFNEFSSLYNQSYIPKIPTKSN